MPEEYRVTPAPTEPGHPDPEKVEMDVRGKVILQPQGKEFFT